MISTINCKWINSRAPESESRPIASAVAVNRRRDSHGNNKNIYQKSVLQDKVRRNSLPSKLFSLRATLEKQKIMRATCVYVCICVVVSVFYFI